MARKPPLLHFVAAMTRGWSRPDRRRGPVAGRRQPLMKALVAHDDWLPEPMAAGTPSTTSSICCMAIRSIASRWSASSGVRGQKTPVHDHTVWGVIGMLRGTECA